MTSYSLAVNKLKVESTSELVTFTVTSDEAISEHRGAVFGYEITTGTTYKEIHSVPCYFVNGSAQFSLAPAKYSTKAETTWIFYDAMTQLKSEHVIIGYFPSSPTEQQNKELPIDIETLKLALGILGVGAIGYILWTIAKKFRKGKA